MAWSIYKITSPSGKSYIGVTKQTPAERWRQHCNLAARGKNHPFYCAIKKYGKESFCVSVLSTHATEECALHAEVCAIKEYRPEYNISPGGEDSSTGVEKLKELMALPAWREAYIIALREGISKSTKHNSVETQKNKQERAAAWRKDNPRKAYEIQRLASRCARRGKRKMKPLEANLMQKAKRRKDAVSKVWAERTPEERRIISEKISASVKSFNKKLSAETKTDRDAQLSKARESINHTVRKRNQKEALSAYWTPERRKEFSIRRKKRG